MFLLTSMYVLHHKNVWVIISCSLMHAFAIHLHACMFCMWHSSSDASDLNQSIVEKQFVQAEGLTFLLRFGVSLILHCLWRSCLLGCMHVWVKVTVEQFSQNLKGTDLSEVFSVNFQENLIFLIVVTLMYLSYLKLK